MIPKIGNLNIAKTEEQESQMWAEVLSHRNKLLANSDWTQLPDSGLTPECVVRWKNWRKLLKGITRNATGVKELAEQSINNLSRRQPFNDFVEDGAKPIIHDSESVEAYRQQVTAIMDAAFNKKVVPSFLDNPALVEEQFQEALDYLTKYDSARAYPLIDVTAELYAMNHKAVAEEFVSRKVMLTKRLANLKQKYFYFQSLVTKATTDVELAEVKAEIDQWISTST